MKALIIASFGNRQEQVQRLVKNIRSFVDYRIHIITTEDSNLGRFNRDNIYVECVDRIWPIGTPRADIRNSNYYKILYALDYGYTSMALLDDDMYIANENFVDGFDIAEKFGAALPLNPRIYVKYNAMGADVTSFDLTEIRDWPQYAPACNFSPFFVAPKINGCNIFLEQLKNELRFNTCRGTLAIWKASWKTAFTPVYLPEQWCVCGSNAEYIKNYTKQLKGKEITIEPMMLHLGHEKVREVFESDIKL